MAICGGGGGSGGCEVEAKMWWVRVALGSSVGVWLSFGEWGRKWDKAMAKCVEGN